MWSNQLSITTPSDRLGEVVRDEAFEAPLAVFDVPAADHEDQRLTAALWDLGEVVVETTDGFVVDEELQ